MIDTEVQRLLDRIALFVSEGGPEARFDELARAAFAFQYRHIGPVRALARARGVVPGDVRSWRDVPPVPALAYKSLDLSPAGVLDGIGGGIEVFRSSGTTRSGGGGEAVRGVHRHPFPGLYRTVIGASFPRDCLAGLEPPVPMLSLIPPREDAPDSSLSFMIDEVIARWGGDSAYAFGAGGLDADRAGAWCRRVEDAGAPALVLATAFALAAWLDRLDRLAEEGARFRLPTGSVLFETGGFKGRRRELSRAELLARVEERLGVPAGRVVREYGMTELTSQLYTPTLSGTLSGGDPERFVAPPWVRIRVLDPETLAEMAEAAPGRPGLVTIFDLANLSSSIHVMTEDLGTMEGGGLRLLGRAAGAELRGCSLTAEEMAGAS